MTAGGASAHDLALAARVRRFLRTFVAASRRGRRSCVGLDLLRSSVATPKVRRDRNFAVALDAVSRRARA
jgi:hypothetical protein